MFAVLMLAHVVPLGPSPVVKNAVLAFDAQWDAIEASPRIVNRTGMGGAGTGVVVAVKDGFAYVLTAHHLAAESDEREVQFFTRKSYPVPDRKIRGVQVVVRYPNIDAALLKVQVGERPPPVLPLAKPGQRPKKFPFDALSVGCSNAKPPTCRVEQIVAKKLVRRPGDAVAFFWELAVAPPQGRSGGPLLDGSGQVIGVCAAARDRRGYYTHLDELLVGLKQDDLAWLYDSRP